MAQCAHMSTVHRLPLSFLVKIFKWFLGFVPKHAVVLSGQSLRCPIRKVEDAVIFPSYDVIHWKRKGNVSAAHRTPGMPSSWTLRVFLYLLRQEDRTGIRNETHQSFENLNQKWKRQWPAWTPTGIRNETHQSFKNFNQKWKRQWPAWTPTGIRNETLGLLSSFDGRRRFPFALLCALVIYRGALVTYTRTFGKILKISQNFAKGSRISYKGAPLNYSRH